MAGYSGTPLPKKLGIKPGHLVMLDGAPGGWDSGWPADQGTLPDGVTLRSGLRGGPADVILAFFTETRRLAQRFPTLKGKIGYDAALWISWPKRAAKMNTDLDENVVRDIGLANGLVDVKVCAVDERWSGLKFVYRTKDRPPK